MLFTKIVMNIYFFYFFISVTDDSYYSNYIVTITKIVIIDFSIFLGGLPHFIVLPAISHPRFDTGHERRRLPLVVLRVAGRWMEVSIVMGHTVLIAGWFSHEFIIV